MNLYNEAFGNVMTSVLEKKYSLLLKTATLMCITFPFDSF